MIAPDIAGILQHSMVWIFTVFVLAAAIINIYPAYEPYHTTALSGLHLPIFLWLVTGAAYIGNDWQSRRGRMNFIRFSGETFIYGVLVMAGVVVLGLFTMALFESIRRKRGDVLFASFI